MKHVHYITAAILAMTVGCEMFPVEYPTTQVAAPTSQPTAPAVPPATQPAVPPATQPSPSDTNIVLRLADSDVLTLTGGVARIGGKNYPVRLTQPATAQLDDRNVSNYLIQLPDNSTVWCQTHYNDDRTRVDVGLLASHALPPIYLDFDPVWRYSAIRPLQQEEAEAPLILQTMYGRPPLGKIKALFNPVEGKLVRVQGNLAEHPEYPEAPSCVSLACGGNGERTEWILSLRLEKHTLDLLDGRTVPTRARARNADWRSSAVAGCRYLPIPGQEAALDIGRQVQHLRGLLLPYGFDHLWTDESVAAEGIVVKPADPYRETWWPRRLGWLSGAHHRLAERGSQYNWQHARELMTVVMSDYWMQWVAGHGTPGPIRVGEPLSLEHARIWATIMGLSGQKIMIGDRLDTLSAERIELIRRVSPPARIWAYTIDHGQLPDLWNLTLDTDGGDNYHVVGAFNWSPQRCTRTLVFSELGVAPGEGERVAAFDFWEKRLLAVATDYVDVHLSPASCRAICLRKVCSDQPTLISTNRHITQGAIDLHDLKFDAEAFVLTGTSDLVANDPYELRIFVPADSRCGRINQVEAAGERVSVREEGPLLVVTIDSDKSQSVKWRIEFVGESRQIDAPKAPAGLTAKQNTRGVQLTWRPHDDWIARYRLYRDGELLAECDGHQLEYQDSQVRYGQTYAYALTAVDALGGESEVSEPVIHQTPLPASTNLADLRPLFFTQEHAGLGINETVDGRPLRVQGRRYYTGIGTHSHSRIRYLLGGGYDLFTGSVGIDDEIADRGSAVFEILVDGEPRWRSDVVTGSGPAQTFQIAVAGKQYLDLTVTDGGDGCDYDHADWLDPYLRVLPPSARIADTDDRADRDGPATQPVGDIPPHQQVAIDTSLGTIIVELDTERTLQTVHNFLSYVDAGSYDNTIMHRVIKDYIAQGGGYDPDLKQLPAAPPIVNQAQQAQTNRRGTIAMARQAQADSATREFFFNLSDNRALDYPHHGGGYCVFGHVVRGMDVLDRIAETPTRPVFQFEYLPTEPVIIRSIRRQ